MPEQRTARRSTPARSSASSSAVRARRKIDGQGRLLLPQDFRQACGIKNEARFIGTVGIIEIWKPDAHDEWARNVAAELDENTKARIRFGGFLQSESGS